MIPPCPNNVSTVNKERIEDTSIANEDDNEGKIGDVDDLDSLNIHFHNTNTNMPSPSSEKAEIADTDKTSPKQKGQNYTREKDILLCRDFINIQKCY